MKKEIRLAGLLFVITFTVVLLVNIISSLIRGIDVLEGVNLFFSSLVFSDLYYLEWVVLFFPYIFLNLLIRPIKYVFKKYSKKHIILVFSIICVFSFTALIFVNAFFYTTEHNGNFYLDIYLNDLTFWVKNFDYPKFHDSMTVSECKHGHSDKNYENKKFSKFDNILSIRGDGVYSDNKDLIFSITNFTSHKCKFHLQSLDYELKSDIKIETQFLKNITAKYNPDRDTTKYTFSGKTSKVSISPNCLRHGRYRLLVSVEDHKDLSIEFDFVETRPMEWEVNQNVFFNPDTIIFKIKNNIGSPVLYPGYQKDYPLIASRVFGYKNNKIIYEEYIPGMCCGTGVTYHPLRNNESATKIMLNPIKKGFDLAVRPKTLNWITLDYDFNQKPIPIASSKFHDKFMELYGDSVGIEFSFYSQSLRWSKYNNQELVSPKIKISTEFLLEKWLEYVKSDSLKYNI